MKPYPRPPFPPAWRRAVEPRYVQLRKNSRYLFFSPHSAILGTLSNR